MKKALLFTGFVTGLLFANIDSHADSYQYSPYIGADYSYSRASFKGIHPEYHAGGVYVGSEYGKYFSTELFLNQSGNDTNNFADGEMKTSYRNYGLDIFAYLPFGYENKFNLVATTGIGEYVFKKTLTGDKHHNDQGLGYRFGGGLKYSFTPKWQMRLLARYIKLDKVSDLDYVSEYSVGMEYHF